MRLWHEQLLTYLPQQQLLGQHRECCALRGNGWGRRHSVVDYVWKHSPYCLYRYHMLVKNEMDRRGYRVKDKWWYFPYRGKNCNPYTVEEAAEMMEDVPDYPIYPEHNTAYLAECIQNLRAKGIEIIMP